MKEDSQPSPSAKYGLTEITKPFTPKETSPSASPRDVKLSIQKTRKESDLPSFDIVPEQKSPKNVRLLKVNRI